MEYFYTVGFIGRDFLKVSILYGGIAESPKIFKIAIFGKWENGGFGWQEMA
jgi:hypothetical protein